jgi:hypothetical protein
MAAITGIALDRTQDRRFQLVATSKREGSRDTVWRAREVSEDGVEWTGWQPFGRLDGGTFSPATHQRFAEGTLEVAVMAQDQEIWRRWQTGPDAWSDWSSLQSPGGDGFLQGDLSLTQNADGRLEVFVSRQDGTAWHRWQVSAGSDADWLGWRPFGPPDGEMLGPILLGRNTAGNLVAFAPATENPGVELALLHRWQLSTAGGGWSPWTSLGKPPGDRSFTQVVAAQNGDGRLEVFTVADDGQVWHRWQKDADDPESWLQPWHSLGEPDKFSEVAVVLDASTRLTLIATSQDGLGLWQRTQETPGGGWKPWAQIPTALEDPLERPLLYLRSNGELGLFLLIPKTGGLHQRLQSPGGWVGRAWLAP